MSLKYVLGLAFRQTQGLIASMLEAMMLQLQVPSYSQFCCRQAHGAESVVVGGEPPTTTVPVHIVVDSTGLKVYGEVEWKVRQHGSSHRRTWRKLHLALNEATTMILAVELTTNQVDDASMVKPLLEQVARPVTKVGADGAYDRAKVYDYLQQRNLQGVIPPRSTAVLWTDRQGQPLEHMRNTALLSIDAVGLAGWKQHTDYQRRSKAETGMYRFKTLFGERLQSRQMANQQAEARLKVACLNPFVS